MKLKCFGSGSSGNCYLLHNDNEALMLEAGVDFKQVLRYVKGKIGKICGCLVTHEHGDHAKYAGKVAAFGIDVYMTQGTNEALGKVKAKVFEYRQFKVGNFIVLPFRTVHDAAEPCGFFIHHKEFGNLLFATDTSFIPNTFKGLNNIMIECNWEQSRLDSRKDVPEDVKERIGRSHMSIDTCIAALKANDLTQVNNIVIIHVSSTDGDKEAFASRVAEATGKDVVAADRELDIEFDKTPF